MSFAWRSRLPLLLVPLLACGPDKDPLDTLTQGGPTGSPTGSPSSGDPSGGSNTSGNSTDDPTGGTGSASDGTASTGQTSETGGSGVHPSCEQWLECVDAVAPADYPQAEESYGPNSTCWQLTPEIAQMCVDACEGSLAVYGPMYPDEPACGGSGGTTTSTTTNTTQTTTQTSETDPSETGGAGYGNCGWDAGNAYYACTGTPGQADPDGVSPIDCPDPLPAQGEPCGENGPVDGIGCCTNTGANYYCGADMTVVIEECGA